VCGRNKTPYTLALAVSLGGAFNRCVLVLGALGAASCAGSGEFDDFSELDIKYLWHIFCFWEVQKVP
jgi:hypothetical protein